MNTTKNDTETENPWRPLEPVEKPQPGDERSAVTGGWFTRRPRPVPATQDAAPPCSTHPDAPHGFDRDGSHTAGRYVCDCEGWVPPQDSAPAAPECKCDMRTKLVGDGCFVCNPERYAEYCATPKPVKGAGGGDQQTAREWLESKVRPYTKEDGTEVGAIGLNMARQLADRADRAEAEVRHNQMEAYKEAKQAEAERDTLRAQVKGFEKTFEAWQEDGSKLATEFPGVDWTYTSDFVPHIQLLRAQLADARSEAHALRVTEANLRSEGDRLRELLKAAKKWVDRAAESLPKSFRHDADPAPLLIKIRAALNQTTNTDDQ